MKKGQRKRRNLAILVCTLCTFYLLSAFSVASACDGDFLGDGDVDGEDLYTYIMNGDFSDVGAFAAEFGKADCEPAPTGLLVDPDFEASVDSADLRADGVGRDWYESRNDVPTLLDLNTEDIGGNTTKKAGFTGSATGSTYVSQAFSTAQTGMFAVEWDIYVDEILDISGSPDRGAWMMIGDDSVGTDGPNATDNERFVLMAFTKNGGGTTGTMALVARDRDDDWTSFTPVAIGMNMDQWYRISVVCDLDADTYAVFVNGEYRVTVTSRLVKDSLTHISFATSSLGAGFFYVDNVQEASLVEVPNSLAMAEADARDDIVSAGLVAGATTTAFHDDIEAGHVISTTPAGGTRVPLGATVALLVSDGTAPVSVPGVVGDDQATAVGSIEALGLVANVTTAHSDTIAEGLVISQDPAAGTLVVSGTTVDLVVSSGGTEQVSMPAVVGLSQSEAEAAIAAAGLVVGSEIQTYTPNVPPGDVISTVPPAGTLIPNGSPVTMVTNVIPVIVDNGSTDTFAVGTWQESSAPNPYNGTSLYGNGGATYTWRLTAPVSGYFNVSIWYTALSSRNTNAEVRIEHADGITSKYVDQTQNGGKWNSLGSFRYDEGETYEVTIIAAGSLSTCADAVRFTKENILRHKWTTRLPGGGQIMPVMGDIDNDGDQEIVMNAGSYIVAVNGKTGAIEWSVGGSAGTSIELADLNRDGVPEVLYGMDGPRLRALNGNGTTRWTSPYLKGEGQARYPILSYDIDGDGYPTIWFASEDSHPDPFNGDMNDYNGALIMLDHNGTVLTDTWIHHPCWGGMALADTDNDDQYEIYLSDRRDGYHDFPANGIQAFNAHTLDPIWARPDIQHSSPLPVLADFDGDGDLEVIATKITLSGPMILDPATGDTIIDYSWRRLPTHATPTVYDIDEDGNLEYIVSTSYPSRAPQNFVVFDLTTGTIDFTATFSDFWVAWPPSVGDVTGDGHMEILVASGSQEEEVGDTRDGDYPLIVYDKNFTMIDWVEIIDAGQLTPARVYDTDGDGYNEVVVAGHNGMLLVFDTESPTPNPAPRSWVQYYSEYRQGAAIYVHPPLP